MVQDGRMNIAPDEGVGETALHFLKSTYAAVTETMSRASFGIREVDMAKVLQGGNEGGEIATHWADLKDDYEKATVALGLSPNDEKAKARKTEVENKIKAYGEHGSGQDKLKEWNRDPNIKYHKFLEQWKRTSGQLVPQKATLEAQSNFWKQVAYWYNQKPSLGDREKWYAAVSKRITDPKVLAEIRRLLNEDSGDYLARMDALSGQITEDTNPNMYSGYADAQ
jgi:hypothetical protein